MATFMGKGVVPAETQLVRAATTDVCAYMYVLYVLYVLYELYGGFAQVRSSNDSTVGPKKFFFDSSAVVPHHMNTFVIFNSILCIEYVFVCNMRDKHATWNMEEIKDQSSLFLSVSPQILESFLGPT